VITKQDERGSVNVKIRRGLEQLDRGEGILEEDLAAYLAKRKAEVLAKGDNGKVKRCREWLTTTTPFCSICCRKAAATP